MISVETIGSLISPTAVWKPWLTMWYIQMKVSVDLMLFLNNDLIILSLIIPENNSTFVCGG